MLRDRDRKDATKSALCSQDSFHVKPLLRFFLIGFGWLNVGFAAVGVVIPGIPTTIFLLIALWAFSQSSERLRSWLYNHPIFGAFFAGLEKTRSNSKKSKDRRHIPNVAELGYLDFSFNKMDGLGQCWFSYDVCCGIYCHSSECPAKRVMLLICLCES